MRSLHRNAQRRNALRTASNTAHLLTLLSPGSPLKLVVLGDGAVGKTFMLATFAWGRFPDEFIPTVFDSAKKAVLVDGVPVL